jgi:hypothetical protein
MHLIHQRLEARRIVQQSKIRIVLHPHAIAITERGPRRSSRSSDFSASPSMANVQGRVCRGIAVRSRATAMRLRAHSIARSRAPLSGEKAGAEAQGARIVRIQRDVMLDDLQRVGVGLLRKVHLADGAIDHAEIAGLPGSRKGSPRRRG